jgi:hypothetical protein
MNIDDPYGELTADGNEVDQRKQPPARRNKNFARLHCEFCGKKGHATTKHSKCTAEKNAVKKYRREDGTLLALPPAATAAVDDDEASDGGFLLPTQLLNDDLEVDCHESDMMPFDTEVQGQYDSDMDIFVDADTWDDDDNAEWKGTPFETGAV